MKRLYFIIRFVPRRFTSYRFVSTMPVKTRSQKKQQQQQQQQQYNTSLANDGFHNTAVTASRATNKGDRRVKIVTPSFIEASTRTYKVYSPRNKPLTASSGGSSSSSSKRKIVFDDDAAATAAATEALLALQYHDNDANEIQYHDDTTGNDYQNYSPSSPSSPSSASVSQRHHACLNPMTPISTYIYRIGIYNIAQTVHYKTAYILYDMTTRLYHVHTIISNQLSSHQETVGGGSELRTEFTLPSAHNTIQIKYKSYIDETVTNFIMTMVVP